MSRQRMNFAKVNPVGHEQLLALSRHVRASGLDPALLELVKIRASQINGCSYCLDLHMRTARRTGMDGRRLDVLAAWRETNLFDARERAALDLTESLTLVAGRGVPDAVWESVRSVFSEAEAAALLMAIVTINVRNRIAIAVGEELPADEAIVALPRPAVDTRG